MSTTKATISSTGTTSAQRASAVISASRYCPFARCNRRGLGSTFRLYMYACGVLQHQSDRIAPHRDTHDQAADDEEAASALLTGLHSEAEGVTNRDEPCAVWTYPELCLRLLMLQCSQPCTVILGTGSSQQMERAGQNHAMLLSKSRFRKATRRAGCHCPCTGLQPRSWFALRVLARAFDDCTHGCCSRLLQPWGLRS